MVSIEKRTQRGRTYYRLVRTVRRNGKIAHLTSYIGKTLPSKERLREMEEDLRKRPLGRIFAYLSPEEAKKIEEKREASRVENESMSLVERRRRAEEFTIRFTYDSSKLSGVNVTLRQTALILKDGIVPKDIKSLLTVRELENHKLGVAAITKHKGVLDRSFMKKIHRILFSGVDDTVTGKFRDELERDVKIAGTPYVPPHWDSLPKEIGNFFRWYGAENKRLHPLELAALVHLKVISMQPFADGNSRVSRLLMNWILWKRRYPLIDIPVEDLEEYYNVLDKYQIEKDEKPFIAYIVKKYMQTR
ncbi:MAG: Fic family protein [Candidatus Altiarchaeota archaeon]